MQNDLQIIWTEFLQAENQMKMLQPFQIMNKDLNSLNSPKAC